MPSSSPSHREGSVTATSPDEGSKPKVQINCAECRRLKLKCDRQIPCASCVRRHCADICPDGVKAARKSERSEREIRELQKHITSLQTALSKHGVPLPAQEPAVSPRNSISSRRSQSPPRERQSTTYPTQSALSPLRDRASPTAVRSSPFWTFPSAETGRIPTPPSFRYQEQRFQPHSIPSLLSPKNSAVPSAGLSEDSMTRRVPAGRAAIVSRSEGSQAEQSHGTLVIDKAGRSRYFGATAGTEWLKNQEADTAEETSWNARNPANTAAVLPADEPSDDHFTLFPFACPRPTLTVLMSHLPPVDEAQTLVDAYYRYYAWLHDVAPRKAFLPIFERVYEHHTSPANSPSDEKIHLQQLALVYAILALGTHHNLEIPPNDATSNEFVNLAKACLASDDFLNHNTIAGVQALVILGHYCLETEKGRTGDTAWPMWGIASRLVVAMGLHRDGERWHLPPAVVQERRQVFWECHTIEVFQANCFSRPGAMAAKHIDTAFPGQDPADAPEGQDSFLTLKYKICQMASEILDEGMVVGGKSYATATRLNQQLSDFERQIPFHMRCRTALLALPSVYPDAETAKKESPDTSRRNLKRTLQQFTLALNVSESILSLQRPYFVMALNENPQDPTRSMYGHSYLVVVERCNVLIQIVSTLYELFPSCIARHWFFWYHLFTAAVCLGTVLITHPLNVLSEFITTQIDLAIATYSSLIRATSSKTLSENHEWLVRLRHRINQKRSKAGAFGLDLEIGANQEEEDRAGDEELLGWRTRLIERAAVSAGQQAATSHRQPTGIQNTLSQFEGSGGISHQNGQSRFPSMDLGMGTYRIPGQQSMSATASTGFDLGMNGGFGTNWGGGGGNGWVPPVQQVLQQHLVPLGDVVSNTMSGGGGGSLGGGEPSTDQLLHQFWDPLMSMAPELMDQGGLASANWWNWDVGGMDGAVEGQEGGDGRDGTRGR